MAEPEPTTALDGRSLGRRGTETRARLLHATAQLLEDNGLRELRVVDIARRVRLAPATFYQYFRDVEEAVLALAAEISVLRERFDTAEQVALARGLDLRAEIEKYQPTLADRERREEWREQFLQRLLQGVTGEVVAAVSGSQAGPGAPPMGKPPAKGPAGQ